MPALRADVAWHRECNFAFQVNAMRRRDALPQRSSHCQDRLPRAARPSVVAPEDLADLEATRAPRESYVALSEPPQMPSMRSRHASVARVELEDGEVEADEVTSFVDRTSLVAASELHEQGPESVTTYAVRPSHVAREEARAPSLEEGVQNGPIDYAALSRYLFDDVAPPHEPPRQPLATRRSRLAIHDDEQAPVRRSMPSMHPRPAAAASFPQPTFTPPTPARPPMASYPSYEAAMQQFQPPVHVAPPMPMSSRRSMPSMHPHDSSADGAWIVPAAPSTRRRAVARPAPPKVTASTVAAAFVALLAVTVMIAAVLFVRSEQDDATTTTSAARMSFVPVVETPVPTTASTLAPRSVIVISSDDIPAVAEAPVAPAVTPTGAAPPAVAVVQVVPAVAPNPAAPDLAPAPAKPVVTGPVVTSPVVTSPVARSVANAPTPTAAPARTAAAPAKKADAKGSDKSVEDLLKELGEEQLRR